MDQTVMNKVGLIPHLSESLQVAVTLEFIFHRSVGWEAGPSQSSFPPGSRGYQWLPGFKPRSFSRCQGLNWTCPSMLSSSSTCRVALTPHKTNWAPKVRSHNLGLVVLYGHLSTNWSGCLLWVLEVKKTCDPGPLEVYPAFPLAFWAFFWSAQAGV